MEREAHAGHLVATRHRRGRVLLRLVGDDGLGGEEQRRDRGCVLQRRAGDLHRVVDAGGQQVLQLLFQNVTFVPMGFPLSSVPLNTGGIVSRALTILNAADLLGRCEKAKIFLLPDASAAPQSRTRGRDERDLAVPRPTPK